MKSSQIFPMTRSNQFFAILKKITTTKSINFLSPNGQDFYVRFLFWVLYYDLNPIHPFFSKLPDFFGMLLIHWYQHSWAAQHIVSLNPNFFKPILENESCLWLSKKKSEFGVGNLTPLNKIGSNRNSSRISLRSADPVIILI